MRTLILRSVLVFAISIWQGAFPQSVGVNTISPDSSAVFEISSEDKGFLIPRMTTLQRSEIKNPAVGLQIYNIDIDCIQFFNGIGWRNCCGTEADDWTQAMAGEDRMTILDTVHLAANPPGLGETGMWTVISGTGGSFDDPADPLTVFHSNGNYQTYILRWTITNPCGNSYDEVEIRFHRKGTYVSFLGNDATGDGSPGDPYHTIQQGVNASLGSGHDKVFVSEGTFPESITIASPSDTVHLIGGHYAHDWNVQDGDIHKTMLRGGTIAVTLSNTGIRPVTIESMEIHSSNGGTGENSIVIKASSALVVVNGCVLRAGNGGPGLDGADGSAGQDGSPGNPGIEGHCSPQPFGGTGGVGATLNTAGGMGGHGGDGLNTLTDGDSGNNGAGGSGNSPGSGGAGGPGVGPCNGGTCNTPSGNPDGIPGAPGADGQNGFGGSGYVIAGGAFTANGGSGGSNGSGGGGGGGGGGCGGLQDCGSPGNIGYGDSGGGGGGGGGGGSPGIAGTGGGSSICILAIMTDLTAQGNIFYKGAGGNGGTGGTGGPGGSGGSGGDGFDLHFDQGVASFSGFGGNGGDGGNGGHGGGGSGGHSIGIARSGGMVNDVNAVNTFSGGIAGSGGKSLGNNGSSGLVMNVAE